MRKKRFICLVVAFSMILSTMPYSVFATTSAVAENERNYDDESSIYEYVEPDDIEAEKAAALKQLPADGSESLPPIEKLADAIYLSDSDVEKLNLPVTYGNVRKNRSVENLEKYNGTYGYEYYATISDGKKFQDFYVALDEAVKRFHSNENANAQNLIADSVNFSTYGLTKEEALEVWKIYKADNPIYYWISTSVSYSDKDLYLMTVEEYAKGTDRVSLNQTLLKEIDEMLSIVNESDTDYRKALAFHDAIVEKINYAYNNRMEPESSLWAHSIVGVFTDKGAVCEGYSKAFQILLNLSDINNIFVTGTANGDAHAWNIVEIDGKWYWYDLTWDDLNRDGSYGALWQWPTVYDYFCVTDSEFLGSHEYDISTAEGVNFLYSLPERATTDYDSDEILLNQSFVVDDITYKKTGHNSLEVVSVSNKSGALKIPETVAYNNCTYDVISLGEALLYSSALKISSIELPKTIKFIWDDAVQCPYLKEIIVDEANPYFTTKDGVLFTKSLYTLIQYPAAKKGACYEIPRGVHRLAYKSFYFLYADSSLKKLTLGPDVEGVGITNWGNGYQDRKPTGFFEGNIIKGALILIGEGLLEGGRIIISEDNKSFCESEGAIYSANKNYLYLIQDSSLKTFVVPKETNYIDYESSIFRINLPNLEAISVEQGNESFMAKDGVLYDHAMETIIATPSKLKGEIVIPGSVTTISNFVGCSQMTSVILSNGTEKIDDGAFTQCTSLKKIELPESVTYIGDRAFSECISLQEIDLPNSVNTIGNDAFCSCKALKRIVIPRKVAQINDYTFRECDNLEEVVISNGVERIGNSAFTYCNLKQIYIPKSVKSIGEYAFSNNKNLANVTITSETKKIERSAFSECINLKDIYYNGEESVKNELVIEDGNWYFENANWHFGLITCSHIEMIWPNQAPTCTKAGWTGKITCILCDEVLTESEEIPKLTTHTYNTGTITTTPTCKAEGVKTYTCTVCSETKTVSVAKVEHNWKAATCTAPKTCNACHTTEGSALGHSAGDAKVTVKATTSKDGKIQTKCTRCSTVLKTTVINKASKVSLSTASYTYNGKKKSPKVVVKDSAGKTISSKYYTVSKPSGRTSIGKHAYIVKFKGNYSGTKKLTLTIKPAKPTIQTPKAAKKAITVKWKKGKKAQVTGYQVMVATNSKFTKNKKTATVNGYSKVSKKMTKLKAKTKYYVKVRTYMTVKGVKTFSDWSKEKTIKTK